MEMGLMSCLLEIFPVLKRMDGENRELQFKLIKENFNIPYWSNQDDINSPELDGKFNPYYKYDYGIGPVATPYLIVKYDDVTMRGRRKITFSPQYALITRGYDGGMPHITCYENTAVDSGKFGQNWNGKQEDGWDRPLHPHISRYEPCLGSFENMLYKESKSNPVAYFTILGKFYRTWNIDSCFWNINRMTPLYSEPGADNNRTILLDAQTYQRIKLNTGTNDDTLRVLVPYFKKQNLEIIHSQFPISVLGMISSDWYDSHHSSAISAKNRLEENVDGYVDFWYPLWNELELIAGDGWKFYRQTILNNPRQILRDMRNQIRNRYHGDFSEMLKIRWDESLKTNMPEILDRMHLEVNGQKVFDQSLRESVSRRNDWLLMNSEIYYPSWDELAEYFSANVKWPDRSNYQNGEGEIEAFSPNDVSSCLKKQRLECGKIAINKLNKQKEVIINEIKTLESNSIEDSILQQQISF